MSISKTENFKVSGSECRLTWENKGDRLLTITLYSPPEKYVDLLCNTIGAKSEVTFIKKSGEYYLDISASDKYKIKIEQRP